MPISKKVSVILPAYNAAETISSTITQIETWFREEKINGEIIVVNDGSQDFTATQVKIHPDVQLIQLPKNSGKGAALRKGMEGSTGDVVVYTDHDLPYGLEPIHRAVSLIQNQGAHVVIGDRRLPLSNYFLSQSPIRKALSSICSVFVRMVVVGGFPDTQCGIKAFRGDVARALSQISKINRFAVDVELLYIVLKYHLTVQKIPVQLQSNSTSSIRVVRDSLQAALDILSLKWRWLSGQYYSNLLSSIYKTSHENLLKK